MDIARVLLNPSEPQVALVAVLSLLLPLSIFVGRRRVRRDHAGKVMKIEEIVMSLPAGSIPRRNVAQSLEMLRSRYVGVHQQKFSDRLLNRLLIGGGYIMPTGIFVLLSACGFALVLGLSGEWLDAADIILGGLRGDRGASNFATATALVLGAGFVGAYIWSIQYLLLRASNYDLSPLDFLRTSVHLLLTVFTAWVLCQLTVWFGTNDRIAVAVVLGVAFVSGLYPSLGLNVLLVHGRNQTSPDRGEGMIRCGHAHGDRDRGCRW